MTIADAQEETRTRFVGGFYGQLVSGVLWLVSASLAVWSSPQAAIATLVVGGFFIFPLTELLVRLGGEGRAEPDQLFSPSRHAGGVRLAVVDALTPWSVSID